MIQLIIFDLSDVCFNCEEPPFLRKFAKKYKLDFKEFDNFYQNLLYKAEVGKMSGKEVWDRVLDRYNIKGNASKLISDMMKSKKAYYGVLNLAKKLRKGYKTAYLTNYNKYYWDEIERRFELKPYFDFGVVSYQIKARKPAPKGFKVVMKRFKAKAKETIFIDDYEKNLVNARNLGINTILFRNKTKLVSDLRKFGVDIK
jgi:FMN phosphatase YigB (HAD superfamily)